MRRKAFVKNTRKFLRSKAILSCLFTVTLLQDDVVVEQFDHFIGYPCFHNDGVAVYRRAKKLRGVYNPAIGR